MEGFFPYYPREAWHLERQQSHIRSLVTFMKEQAETVAILARDGHQRLGAGFILIDSVTKQAQGVQFMRMSALYVNPIHARLREVGINPREIAQAILNADREETFVVMFLPAAMPSETPVIGSFTFKQLFEV